MTDTGPDPYTDVVIEAGALVLLDCDHVVRAKEAIRGPIPLRHTLGRILCRVDEEHGYRWVISVVSDPE